MDKALKMKPELIALILERKKANPQLSSRRLSIVLSQELKVRVSKSSINEVLKEAGLSLPAGRPVTKPRPRIQMPSLPALELKKETLPAPPPKPAQELKPAPAAELTPPPVKEPAPPAAKPAPEPEPAPAPEPEKPPAPPEPVQVEVTAEILALAETSGVILLKAADYLTGGSLYLQESLRGRLHDGGKDLAAKVDGLTFLPLFGESQESLSRLWPLIGKKLSPEIFSATLAQLEEMKGDCPQIWSGLVKSMPEVRCIKVNFSDTDIVYLDGQFYTAWSTPHLAYDFDSAIFGIKRCLDHYLKAGPFVLFMAPGYASPTQEFFNFVLGLEGRDKKITRLTFCGNNFEELGSSGLAQQKNIPLVFGLWPWQFSECRKVKKISAFRPFTFSGRNLPLYLGEIELDLFLPNANRLFTFRGSALKTKPEEKVRLVVLTNSASFNPEELANLYLDNWPNFEEAFQDYSRKIELFTYTAHSQSNFTQELSLLKPEFAQDATRLFDHYLHALDLYVRWHFLPAGYEKESLATVKERFYGLKSELKQEGNLLRACFIPESNFAYLNDLQYAVRRLNEREIKLGGLRLWFAIAAQ